MRKLLTGEAERIIIYLTTKGVPDFEKIFNGIIGGDACCADGVCADGLWG